MNKLTAKRVGEIEFFRFLFSVFVMLYHSFYFFDKELILPGGNLGVEFFFLVSGYLMMAHIDRISGKVGDSSNLGAETASFLKRKIAAVYPELIVSFVLSFVVQCFLRSLSGKQAAKMAINSVYEVLLTRMTGLGYSILNGAIWYIQAMLLCMAILYPLIRRFPDMMQRIIMPIMATVFLGYLFKNFKTIAGPTKWMGLTYRGNLRAMAELCLGAECYRAARYLRKYHFTNLAKVLLTVLKWACWLFTLLCVWKGKYQFTAIAALFAAVSLAFSQQCADLSLFQNQVTLYLGRLSLPIYLGHFFFARYLGDVFPENMRNRYKLAIYLLCVSVTTALIVIFAGIIRKKTPDFKAAMKRWFLVSD